MAWRGRAAPWQGLTAAKGLTGQFDMAMGRTYAGILGSLAFALVAARCAIAGSGLEASVLAASAALFVFAAAGYLAGRAAEFLIRDSVRTQFQQAMADWSQKTHSIKTQAKSTT